MIKFYSSLLLTTFLTLSFLAEAPVTMAAPTQENPREWFFEFCRGQGHDSMKACYCSVDFVESNLFESEFRALVSELKKYLPLDRDENSGKLERAYESNRLVDARVSEIYSMAFDQEECLVLEPGGREYLARLALHNLYLSCKAFWVDHGSKAQCSLKEPMDDEYGYYPLDNIKVVALGNEYEFKATAKHRWSDHVYEITADGEIKEVGFHNKTK
jgi:hypothetical protein